LFYEIAAGDVRVPDWKGPGYRLPTEAEWEYACRAGTSTRYSFGDDPKSLGEYGWYDANSEGMTHPVGQKQANALGLFDMHGNVREWCGDGISTLDEYYANSPTDDPQGDSRAWKRVCRGGCLASSSSGCRSASRYEESEYAGAQYFRVGFRVARGQTDR
jgi:formylglycine-generating enzyme required for sulfatase activity